MEYGKWNQIIMLAHFAWEKTSTKWKRKYFENEITEVDDVKTIQLRNVFLTLLCTCIQEW